MIDKKILKYKRMVYYGFSRDEKILELAKEYVDKDIVFVVIVPATKKYDRALNEAIVTLKDRIWVYELSMGLMANLKSKRSSVGSSTQCTFFVFKINMF